MSTAPVVEVFAALSDPNRQHLLESLAQQGHGASATTLAAALPVTRQAVNKHLRVLQQAGLVGATRRGREVRYAVRREQLDRSAAWLTDLAERWDRRLAGIKAVAESTSAQQ